MKKAFFGYKCLWLFAAVFGLLFSLFCINGGGRYEMNAVTASAEGRAVMAVEAYDIDMTVGQDRKIAVKEKITVKFLAHGLTMFYRALPTDGARYFDITASCVGNDEFSFYVEDDPDVDGFIDINCVGNADYGKTWTYEISYLMQQSVGMGTNRMSIDVVGFGWTVPLNEVTVTVRLPEKPTAYDIRTDIFGTETNNEVTESWSEDGKTLMLYSPCLGKDDTYVESYDEMVSGGITLDITLPEGAFENYTHTRIFTGDMWKIWLGGGIAVVLALMLVFFTKKKREIVTVVHVSPPDNMDPLKMGKWLDGSADSEDITSIVYYFANEGYLKINLTDEDDPELIALVEQLPQDAPVYQKTLFDGLFKQGREVRVSELAEKFYASSQKAIQQLPSCPKRYENKSVLGYLSGGFVGLLLAFLVPMLMSLRIGGGYVYFLGAVFVIPLGAIAFIGGVTENYRHKWKMSMKLTMRLAQGLIALCFSLLFIFFFAEFIMTEYEKAVLCGCVFLSCFATQGVLSYTEKYLETLGDILGFKEFIVVTEEDKIEFMLKENPELYYKILPYAQVLGVTEEWENKFARLTIEPPSWYVGSHMTVFDYYLINRCMTRSMMSAMARAAQASVKGSTVGRSGGGGSFGGFGGGGFGGGGGGAR